MAEHANSGAVPWANRRAHRRATPPQRADCDWVNCENPEAAANFAVKVLAAGKEAAAAAAAPAAAIEAPSDAAAPVPEPPKTALELALALARPGEAT